MNTIQMNNNTASDIARAFEFRANTYRDKAGHDAGTATAKEQRARYGQACVDYEDAAAWFSRARGMTIGHNKRERYEQAQARCREQGELCSAYQSEYAEQI